MSQKCRMMDDECRMKEQTPRARGAFCILRSALCILLLLLLARAGLAYSLEQEIKLGQDVSREAEKEMPLSKNEKWQQDVTELGKRFLPYVNRKEIPYHFRVIAPKDEHEINAFAIPGGHIYFTERMWRIMTPDERAGVMAHEIVHCDRRHGIDMMLKSQQRALWLLPLIIATGGGALAEVAMLGNMAISQRYSRKMEREADEEGIKLLKAAGFDPAGQVRAMKKLLSIENDQNRYEISALFASHPDTQRRIDYLSSAALALGSSPGSLELEAVDDPSRLGNVTSKVKETNAVNARTMTRLQRGQVVQIKKLLWDDEASALVPRTIATATVLTPGTLPILLLNVEKGVTFGDVMPGDGVYPSLAESGEPGINAE